MKIELRNIDVDARRIKALSGEVWRAVKPWVNKAQQARLNWSALTIVVKGTKKESNINRGPGKVIVGLPSGVRRNESRFAKTLTAALFWRAGCDDPWGRAGRLTNPAGDPLFEGWDGTDGLPVILLPKKEAAKATKAPRSRMEETHSTAVDDVVKREGRLAQMRDDSAELEARMLRAEKGLHKARLKVAASKKRLDKKEASIEGDDSRTLPRGDFAERMKRRRAKEDEPSVEKAHAPAAG